MAPLIGISVTPTLVEGRTMEAVNRVYVRAVQEAGGIPVVLPTLEPHLVEPLVGRLDGVVLSGGGDVHPDRYGAPPSVEIGGIDVERDAWELAVVRYCAERHLPLLAVCRGLQVLNVAFGGTLVQHLPDRSTMQHREPTRYAELVHPVTVAPGSRLANVLGRDEIGVNTLHHQAVERPGCGLRAVAWAPDGTVEAVEHDGDLPLLGVQWHPELLTGHRAHAALFRWIVAGSSAVRSDQPNGTTAAAAERAAA